MTRRNLLSRRLSGLAERSERKFRHDNVTYLPPTVVRAVEDCWLAIAEQRLDRAEQLLDVITLLVIREHGKYKSDPKRWVERQRDMAAA